ERRWDRRNDTVTFDARQLQDGSTFGSRATISRQIGRAQTVGFVQEYQLITTRGRDAPTLGLLGSWRANVAAGFSMNALGGITSYRLVDSGTERLTPTGSVGLTGQ